MQWVLDELRRRGGSCSFEEYMELALYHPEYGYYSGREVRYGRSGDFLTAPTASPWYGRVMARLMKTWKADRDRIVLVDLAAGDASFLRSLLAELAPGDFPSRLVAVEQSSGMQERCRRALSGLFPSVEVVSRLEDAAPPDGFVFLHASELYDALPVARVVRRESGLQEFRVRIEGSCLEWEEKPARPEVMEYFRRHEIVLLPGQIAEANLRAEALHCRHLQWAGDDALVMVLDYGYDSGRLYNSRGRFQGSLSCFYRHELSRDPLVRPGEQDITAHVNWDDLRRAADSAGWRELSLDPLALFLYRSGIGEITEEMGLGMEAELDARTVSERQEMKRLLDPEGMGSDLKVLVQGSGKGETGLQRNIPAAER